MIPAAVDRVERPLLRAYERAWNRILTELEAAALEPARYRQRRKLIEAAHAIRDVLAELNEEAYGWATEQLPRIYQLGGAQALAQVGQGSFSWSAIDREAVQLLANGLMDELLASTRYTSSSLVSLIRAAAGDETLQLAIQGRTARQAGDALRNFLTERGFVTLRYNDGSLHTMREYARMAVRTTTAKAYNYGALSGAASVGVTHWEVFDGPGCGWSYHGDPNTALGSIVDSEEAARYPISHPNCRRSFGPRPDLSASAPATSGLGSVTPEQTRAQMAADAVARSTAQRQRNALARRNRRLARRIAA